MQDYAKVQRRDIILDLEGSSNGAKKWLYAGRVDVLMEDRVVRGKKESRTIPGLWPE